MLDLFGSFDNDRRKSCLSKISPSATPNKKEPTNQSQKHMKPKTIQSLLVAALLAPGALYAQTSSTTTPVGYVTETLKPGSYNLIGLTLQNTPVAAGVLTSSDSVSVSASAVDFTALLTSGKTYILELNNGTVQEITAWSGSSLTTPQNISSQVTNNVTTFKLREADTISSVFGATNSVGLAPSPDGDLAVADKVIVSTDSGLVTIYYFNDGEGTEGWFTDGGDPAENIVLAYPDGFFVERAPAVGNISLVISGEVKTKPTSGVLVPGYNYLSSVAPLGTGLNLGNSGLENFISQSTDGEPSTVDNVFIPLADGSYETCYYFNDGEGTEGWFTAGGDPAESIDLTSGYLIYSLSVGNKPYTSNVPTNFDSL
jgi:hypothetical protein